MTDILHASLVRPDVQGADLVGMLLGARSLRSRAWHRSTPDAIVRQRWLGHRGVRIGSFNVQWMPVVQAWAVTTARRNGQTMYDGVTESIEIEAPTERVWAVVSDVSGLPAVLSGMTRLEVDGEDVSLRVGLTWTQTRVIRGHSGSETIYVTEVDNGSRYVTMGGSHGFEYVTTWSVLSLGAHRSRLSCTFLGVPRTWLARIMLRMFARSGDDASRAAMRADLSDIAAAVGSVR